MSELDLSELTHGDDTLDLGDGMMLRFRVEQDHDADPFDNFACYGRVAPVERDYHNPYHHEKDRPDGFTGNAEKLYVPNNGGTYWWEPPSDGPKRGTGEFKRERQHVVDILEYGMEGYVLELCDGEDGYGDPIVRFHASLWGIEPFAEQAYRSEIIRDLYSEINAQLRAEVAV